MQCSKCKIREEQEVCDFTIKGVTVSLLLCRPCCIVVKNHKDEITDLISKKLSGYLLTNVKIERHVMKEEIKTVLQTFRLERTRRDQEKTRDLMMKRLTSIRRKEIAETAGQPAEKEKQVKTFKTLSEYSVHLTQLAREEKLPLMIGREKEVEETLQILKRKQKNSPVLIGEAGVGKTAVIEGLAQRIVKGDVPDSMKEKEIYTLDLCAMVAGTKYRGDFEQRVKNVVKEIKGRKEILLFIDEIHMMSGAGDSKNGTDAANLLKPYLARGEIQLIGATTHDEYREFIEKDTALERRFTPVYVKEPTEEVAHLILKGIQHQYENHHQVTYSEEAIKACISYSKRYLPNRNLPDKAIDLMDEVGSVHSLHQKMSKESGENKKRIETLETDIKNADQQKKLMLQKEIDSLKNKAEKEESARPIISKEDVIVLLEKKTGISIQTMEENELEQVKSLSERLTKRVIGQNQVIDEVVRSVKRAKVGLRKKEKPVASFLFIGPTGVGKTELAKALADEMYHQSENMIRFDMSEFMEPHSVSRLIGSPPGYVGSDKGGELTEKVKRNPHVVLLFDEIEKAHPDIQHIFLQILDEGHLRDGKGRYVSFKDAMIIMTSNAGVDDKTTQTGFQTTAKTRETNEEKLYEKLSKYFGRPEFINRFDRIVEFNSLGEEELEEIMGIAIKETETLVKEMGYTLHVTAAAKKKLVRLTQSKRFGARPLKRTVQRYVEDVIANELVETKGENLEGFYIDETGGEITARAVTTEFCL